MVLLLLDDDTLELLVSYCELRDLNGLLRSCRKMQEGDEPQTGGDLSARCTSIPSGLSASVRRRPGLPTFKGAGGPNPNTHSYYTTSIVAGTVSVLHVHVCTYAKYSVHLRVLGRPLWTLI